MAGLQTKNLRVLPGFLGELRGPGFCIPVRKSKSFNRGARRVFAENTEFLRLSARSRRPKESQRSLLCSAHSAVQALNPGEEEQKFEADQESYLPAVEYHISTL